jgi:hypothetical protein
MAKRDHYTVFIKKHLYDLALSHSHLLKHSEYARSNTILFMLFIKGLDILEKKHAKPDKEKEI